MNSIINSYDPVYFKDHYPVMWRNVLGIIDEYVTSEFNEGGNAKAIGDFTIGCGNHSSLILNKFKKAHVVGVDLDKKMIEYNYKKLIKFIKQKRLVLVEDSYVAIDVLHPYELFEENPIFPERKKFDFVLVDLGFNSMQLEDNEKGISFKNPEATLDMRYDLDNDNKSKANDILNHSTELELMEIFSKFGEERYYESLTKNIMTKRDIKRFETVGDFLNVINQTYSSKANEKFSTYTRLFQALRIAVNYELLNIQRFLAKALYNLEENGILCVISFHSLEDKIVANFIKEWQKNNLGKSIFTHGIRPSPIEIEENSKSHSAILRAFKFKPFGF